MKRAWVLAALLGFLSCIGPGLNPGDTSTSPIDPGGGVGGRATLAGFSPTVGPKGTTLAIQGENFATGATVTVGQPCENVTVVSTTEITCTLGANSPGEYDVVVDNPGGGQIAATQKFTSTAFLYANGDDLYGYKIAPGTGALSAIAGTPLTDLSGDAIPFRHPSGKFLFVHSQIQNSVFVFRVNPESGALTNVSGSPFSACPSEGNGVVIGGGNYIAIPCAAVSEIKTYAFNVDTGALTLASTANSINEPLALTPNADGSLLYFTNTASHFRAFSVNASTGALSSALGPATIDSNNVTSIIFFPDVIFYGINTSIYGNSPTDLSEKNGSPWSGIGITRGMVATPGGEFLYTTLTNQLRGFSWNGTTVSQISGSPFPISGTAHKIGIDPGGNFVFTQSEITGKIYSFRRDSAGVLTETGEVNYTTATTSLGTL